MSHSPRLKVGAHAAGCPNPQKALRLSRLLPGRRASRRLHRLVTLLVIVSCLLQPVSPAVAYVPLREGQAQPEAMQSTGSTMPQPEGARQDAAPGAAGDGALARKTPSPAPPTPIPDPDEPIVHRIRKPPEPGRPPADESSEPVVLTCVLPHEVEVSPSDISVTGVSSHWWHREVQPDDDPYRCPGGGANVPNRVMYGTDNCNLLYLRVVDPVDNEQYVWRFYDPQGNFYASASATFKYPDNPTNPCASQYPGYYAWEFYPSYPDWAICYPYKPSATNLA